MKSPNPELNTSKVMNHSKDNGIDKLMFEEFEVFNRTTENKFKETDQLSREFMKGLIEKFNTEDRNKIYDALMLMYTVHIYQNRPDGNPEIIHSISVAKRVLEMLPNPDKDLVISALLHDSIENQAGKLSSLSGNKSEMSTIDEHGESITFLKKRYGDRVSKIVSGLTNPDFADILKKQEIEKDNPNYQNQKNKLYAEHVKKAIEDEDVLTVKLADFSDNALKLSSWKPKTEEEKKRICKLKSKYLPVMQIFIKRLERDNLFLEYQKRIRQEMEFLENDNKVG